MPLQVKLIPRTLKPCPDATPLRIDCFRILYTCCNDQSRDSLRANGCDSATPIATIFATTGLYLQAQTD